MNPVVLGFLLIVITMAMPRLASAQEGCENLAENAEYDRITTEGADLAAAEEHEEALEKFGEAQKICPYDPVITYYMARARQMQGKCESAIDLFGQAKSQLEAGMVTAPEELADAIQAELEETKATCKPETVISVTCSDGDTKLSIDGADPVPCPADFEVEPGEHEITATRHQHQPWTQTVEVAAGKTRALAVPALESALGTLRVSCPEDVDEVVLMSPDDVPERLACGEPRELSPGAWGVRLAESTDERTVDVFPGETATVALSAAATTTDETTPPPEAEEGGIGGVGIAGSILLVIGAGAVGGGTAMHFIANDEVEKLNRDQATFEMTWKDAKSDYDAATTMNTAGIAVIGVGGALVAAGVLMVALDAVGGGGDVDASAQIGRDNVALSIRARF